MDKLWNLARLKSYSCHSSTLKYFKMLPKALKKEKKEKKLNF
jgi:hypothetical protein